VAAAARAAPTRCELLAFSVDFSSSSTMTD
jgi:hypothetical protein